jgi:hypothetical protein
MSSNDLSSFDTALGETGIVIHRRHQAYKGQSELGVCMSYFLLEIRSTPHPSPPDRRSGQCGLVIPYIERPLE